MTVSLRKPPRDPVDLIDFPTLRWEKEQQLFRIVRKDRRTWWFSSSGAGRFDLSADGLGTCYLATDPHGAIVEVFRGHPVDSKDVDVRVMCITQVPARQALADTTSVEAAGYGITKELITITPYDLPQEWADCWFNFGLNGIFHELRHDVRPVASGVSLFGRVEVSDEWKDGTESPLTIQDLRQVGVPVLDRPAGRNVHILAEPARASRPSRSDLPGDVELLD